MKNSHNKVFNPKARARLIQLSGTCVPLKPDLLFCCYNCCSLIFCCYNCCSFVFVWAAPVYMQHKRSGMREFQHRSVQECQRDLPTLTQPGSPGQEAGARTPGLSPPPGSVSRHTAGRPPSNTHTPSSPVAPDVPASHRPPSQSSSSQQQPWLAHCVCNLAERTRWKPWKMSLWLMIFLSGTAVQHEQAPWR